MLHTSLHATRRRRAIRRLRLAIAAGVVLPWLCLAPPGCGKASSSAVPADAFDSADLPGSDAPAPFEDTTADATDGADAVDAGPPCPSGQLRGLDGVCFPVGIQGCAALFLDEEGLCDPSMSKCPPGTIPKFDEGCVPVGIQGCVELFMEEDGLCHPRMDKCPPGTIPKFDEGCMPVGIQGCAALFMEDDGLCHPSIDKCPDGTFAVPQEGCVPIDGPGGCGEGTWGPIADGPDTFYVDPTYTGDDSDGSRERPGRTIAAVMPLVPKGGRLVLAAGAYDEPLHLTSGIEVVGRCPSMVTISGVQDAGFKAVVWVDQATGAAIRGIGVSGAGIGIAVTGASQLTIQQVRIREATRAGVAVGAGSTDVTLDHVLVERTQSDEGGRWGRGVQVFSGSRVTLTNSALIGNRENGLLLSGDGTEVEAAGNLIEATLPQDIDHAWGMGVTVSFGARGDLTDNALVRNHAFALMVVSNPDAETSVQASANLIADTLAAPAGEGIGCGAELRGGALTTLVGNAFVDNLVAGVHVGGEGTRGTLRGNLVRGTRRGPDARDPGSAFGPSAEMGGVGVAADPGATAVLEENAIVGNLGSGLVILGADTTARATGNLFEGTKEREIDGRFGYGVLAELGGKASLSGNALVSNREYGLRASGAETKVDMTSDLVEATAPSVGWPSGSAGLFAADDSKVTVTGCAVVGNGGAGLWLTSIAQADVQGNLIAGTRELSALDPFAVAVVVDSAPGVTLVGNAITGNHGGGLLVQDLDHGGARVEVVETLVERTTPLESTGEWGFGVVVEGAGQLAVTSSVVRESHIAALAVGGAGTTVLVSHSLLRGTRAGRFINLVDGTLHTGAGDGVLVQGGAYVDLSRTLVLGCVRAGIVFDGGVGRIARTASMSNEYGLVLQGSPVPDVGEGNVFQANAGADFVPNGTLAVPDLRSLLP